MGAATLVPPNPVQRPSQYATTPPAEGSAGYEKSGTARQVLSPQGVVSGPVAAGCPGLAGHSME